MFVSDDQLYPAQAAIGQSAQEFVPEHLGFAGLDGDAQELIPTVIDQNPCAHLRMPRDMIFHGWSMRLFQAWQHSATMSS